MRRGEGREEGQHEKQIYKTARQELCLKDQAKEKHTKIRVGREEERGAYV